MEPIDHATREGDGMLTRDQASLALVRDLRVLLVDVIPGAGKRSGAVWGGRDAHGRGCEYPYT